jgi:hypothetical protein
MTETYTYFSLKFSKTADGTIRVWRFPGFARSSFWQSYVVLKSRFRMKHCWNDTTGETRSSHHKNLSQHHSVHHEWHGLVRNRTQASWVGGWRLTVRAIGTPCVSVMWESFRLDVQSLIPSRYLLRLMNRFFVFKSVDMVLYVLQT